MRRNIIQIRDSTQLVSLPREWCIAHNLKKGDEVDVYVQGDAIVISTDFKPSIMKTEIDINDLRQGAVWLILTHLYSAGFDEIMVKFDNKYILDRKNNKIETLPFLFNVVNELIGMDIVKQGKNFVIIKEVSLSNPEKIDEILNRMIWALQDYMLELQRMINENDFENVGIIFNQKEKTMNRQYNYCLRVLNKNKYKEIDKLIYKADFVRNIEWIGDKISDLANELALNNAHTKEIAPTIPIIKEMINDMAAISREFKKEKMKSIYENMIKIKNMKSIKNQKIYKLIYDCVSLIEQNTYLLWVLNEISAGKKIQDIRKTF